MTQERPQAEGIGSPVSAEGRLPDFLVIGAPKAGTTSLANWLRVHPDIYVPDQKEVRFFDEEWDRGIDWYREQFARVGTARVCGEATPTYLAHQSTVDRVAEVVPAIRAIALLRHPIDRAWSHYWFARRFDSRRSHELPPFAEMVEAEATSGPGPASRDTFLAHGRYAAHLSRWERRVGRDQLHVELFDDLEADPKGVFVRVCRFLDVDPSRTPGNVGKAYNANYRIRSPRLRMAMYRWRLWKRLPFRLGFLIDRLNQAPLDYPQMDPELRRRLVAEFEADNAALAEWLGRPLPEAWGR